MIATHAGCYIGADILASMPHSINLYWSVADIWQVLMPLLLFRMLDVEPDFTIKRPSATKVFKALAAIGMAFLIIRVIVRICLCTAYGEPSVYAYRYAVYSDLALSAVGILIGVFVGERRTWTTCAATGMVLASIVSDAWGAWALALVPGLSPLPEGLLPAIFSGWAIGDATVLAIIGTALLVLFKRSIPC